MNIATSVAGFAVFDLAILLFLFAFFLLGYIQGSIRRILGIASILFSLLLAANVKDGLGEFLGRNWTQFPREYATMIGFLTVFVAAVIAFSLVIQGTYQKASLFERATFLDELLGGLLGIVQGALFLVCFTMILDTFFLLRAFPVDPDELPFLRTLWTALDGSVTGSILHGTVIPGLVAIVGFLLPESIRSLYRS